MNHNVYSRKEKRSYHVPAAIAGGVNVCTLPNTVGHEDQDPHPQFSRSKRWIPSGGLARENLAVLWEPRSPL